MEGMKEGRDTEKYTKGRKEMKMENIYNLLTGERGGIEREREKEAK